MKYLLIALLFFTFSCNKLTFNRKTAWFASTFTPDTTFSEIDSSYYKRNFYLGHYIEVSDTGKCILIKRESFGKKRECFEIDIDEKTKNQIFELANDSNTYNYTNINKLKDGKLYCGLTYAIINQHGKHFNKIQYFPMYTQTTLKQLHEQYESILINPKIIKEIKIDTLYLDSLLFEKIKNFPCYAPPKLSKAVKFIP